MKGSGGDVDADEDDWDNGWEDDVEDGSLVEEDMVVAREVGLDLAIFGFSLLLNWPGI